MEETRYDETESKNFRIKYPENMVEGSQSAEMFVYSELMVIMIILKHFSKNLIKLLLGYKNLKKKNLLFF